MLLTLQLNTMAPDGPTEHLVRLFEPGIQDYNGGDGFRMGIMANRYDVICCRFGSPACSEVNVEIGTSTLLAASLAERESHKYASLSSLSSLPL